ncbi:hypothetical protein NEMBOFW57_004304 [Staphylotrichum longicolle]|uniref:Sm protein F n=1 Tax=Staphylotrichum longicolle TaxID=669026 RepID=A0AAD4F7P6_9PEZI|nr:hypothetical protein NEMBOFW57_004304 [Staphylotrichum longicolle]KAJ4307071.1 hypothetical protein N0V88_000446 [Collariella sp. IMI 366227]
MSFVPVNPRPFLQDLVNKDVVVRLKWGETEYKGRLVSIDSYMNIQLSNTEEFIDRKFTGALGQVLIRCNNVLYVTAADKGEGDRDTKMEG